MTWDTDEILSVECQQSIAYARQHCIALIEGRKGVIERVEEIAEYMASDDVKQQGSMIVDVPKMAEIIAFALLGLMTAADFAAREQIKGSI